MTYPLVPVDGVFSEYGEWTDCDAVGNRAKTRNCDNPAQSPLGEPCDGVPTETETCIVPGWI